MPTKKRDRVAEATWRKTCPRLPSAAYSTDWCGSPDKSTGSECRGEVPPRGAAYHSPLVAENFPGGALSRCSGASSYTRAPLPAA